MTGRLDECCADFLWLAGVVAIAFSFAYCSTTPTEITHLILLSLPFEQGLWQEFAWTVETGFLRNSSLILDEVRSDINSLIAQKVEEQHFFFRPLLFTFC